MKSSMTAALVCVVFSIEAFGFAGRVSRLLPEVGRDNGWTAVAQTSNEVKQTLKKDSEVPDKLTIPKTFHIAGIPDVRRNVRGDLVLTDRELVFLQGKKQRLSLPFARIRRVQFLSGERNYENAAYAAAVGAGIVGALLILKKHKVDTLVFDYENERGGLMGMVIQTELKQGSSCKDWLARFGVTVEEPPAQNSSAKEKYSNSPCE